MVCYSLNVQIQGQMVKTTRDDLASKAITFEVTLMMTINITLFRYVARRNLVGTCRRCNKILPLSRGFQVLVDSVISTNGENKMFPCNYSRITNTSISTRCVNCLNTMRTGDADLRFYITTVQDGWRKSAFLTRACFPCTIQLIMKYIEPVSEWSCWRMFIETWPHSELTFRHRASSI